ncbi:MAG: MFS transporter [Lapillicoccus sp.]
MMKRPMIVVLAGAVGMLGWGAVLPYQYAYAASTRGWGTLVAVAASSLFSVGALLAAPVGGRLADRVPPVRVAVVARSVAALSALGLLWAGTPGVFLVAMFMFGVGITAGQPAQSVLVLRWSGSADRRKVFAWAFTGSSIGMAIGALLAAHVADLHRVDGLNGAFLLAAGGFVVSALLIALAGRGDMTDVTDATGVPGVRSDAIPESHAVSGRQAIRILAASPALRWVAVVTVLIALGFYAQFESGLPAFALTLLDVPEQTVGTAAAVNCLVIVALQMVVVRLTSRRNPASLLVAVGLIWVLSWGVLALAMRVPGIAATLFVTTFGIFAVGETLFAPILNPLSASLAPHGMVGTTLGLLAALQTGVSAAGPLLAGLALGAGHGTTFVVIHLVISAGAVLAAVRLRRVLARPQVTAVAVPPRLSTG